MHNDTHLENSLEILKKFGLSYDSAAPLFKYKFKHIENGCSNKNLHTNVYSSITCNYQ